jgi:hypothetical protein
MPIRAHAAAATEIRDGAIILDPQQNRFDGNIQAALKITHSEL